MEPSVRSPHDGREHAPSPPRRAAMRVCTPHCGLDAETRLGGEMYEVEILREMAGRGIVFDILLARHKRHPGAPLKVGQGAVDDDAHRSPGA